MKAHNVECIRYGITRDELEHSFATETEAMDYTHIMLNGHYRVWINNVEVTRKDFEHD